MKRSTIKAGAVVVVPCWGRGRVVMLTNHTVMIKLDCGGTATFTRRAFDSQVVLCNDWGMVD